MKTDGENTHWGNPSNEYLFINFQSSLLFYNFGKVSISENSLRVTLNIINFLKTTRLKFSSLVKTKLKSFQKFTQKYYEQ